MTQLPDNAPWMTENLHEHTLCAMYSTGEPQCCQDPTDTHTETLLLQVYIAQHLQCLSRCKSSVHTLSTGLHSFQAMCLPLTHGGTILQDFFLVVNNSGGNCVKLMIYLICLLKTEFSSFQRTSKHNFEGRKRIGSTKGLYAQCSRREILSSCYKCS